jgi:hypothetical protein
MQPKPDPSTEACNVFVLLPGPHFDKFNTFHPHVFLLDHPRAGDAASPTRPHRRASAIKTLDLLEVLGTANA